MLYKSQTIEFLPDNVPVGNLCVYNDYYYFESPVEFPEAEIVSQEEFNEAVNSIIHVDGMVKYEPEYEPTETELIQAELLLNQIDIIAKQNEQDEVLAEILLNQMGV